MPSSAESPSANGEAAVAEAVPAETAPTARNQRRCAGGGGRRSRGVAAETAATPAEPRFEDIWRPRRHQRGDRRPERGQRHRQRGDDRAAGQCANGPAGGTGANSERPLWPLRRARRKANPARTGVRTTRIATSAVSVAAMPASTGVASRVTTAAATIGETTAASPRYTPLRRRVAPASIRIPHLPLSARYATSSPSAARRTALEHRARQTRRRPPPALSASTSGYGSPAS